MLFHRAYTDFATKNNKSLLNNDQNERNGDNVDGWGKKWNEAWTQRILLTIPLMVQYARHRQDTMLLKCFVYLFPVLIEHVSNSKRSLLFAFLHNEIKWVHFAPYEYLPYEQFHHFVFHACQQAFQRYHLEMQAMQIVHYFGIERAKFGWKCITKWLRQILAVHLKIHTS